MSLIMGEIDVCTSWDDALWGQHFCDIPAKVKDVQSEPNIEAKSDKTQLRGILQSNRPILYYYLKYQNHERQKRQQNCFRLMVTEER